MQLKKNNELLHTRIETQIEKMKHKAKTLVFNQKYEDALLLISCIADIMYQYNQYYVDVELEDMLEDIQTEIGNIKEINMNGKRDTVVFYDGFGLDLRGLALIYLNALVKSNYKLVYIVRESRKDKIPTIKDLLNEYKAQIIYMPAMSLVDEYKWLIKNMPSMNLKAGFLYTTPNDVSGIMAFMSCEGAFDRYQINLTDHAFWLGIHAFDYCIEFRDYGASISHLYRNIPKERIIKLPYYPFVDTSKEFEGFPFAVDKDDIIIFSGGALYKTFDGDENLYYKIVDFCLSEFCNVKFWYAGEGNDSELRKLGEKYQGRVFHTGERRDLFQVLLHVDLYLNTYPVVGGLMMQYAAMAGKLPLTLYSGDVGKGILLNQNNLEIEFKNIQELKEQIGKVLRDKKYREKKGDILKSAVISQSNFEEDLLRILEDYTSNFGIEYWVPDVEDLRKIYRTRFEKQGIERSVGKKKYMGIIRYFPDTFVKGIVIGGGYGSKENIQVTVVVVTYNPSWEKLKRTLCSILMQKNIKLEIIVADDGSVINYFEDIKKIFSKYYFEEYTLLPSSENKGTCENFYRATILARGEFVKGISPGDYLYDENTLADFYRFSRANVIDVCFGDVIYYSDDNRGFVCYKTLSHPKNMKIYNIKYRGEKQREKALRLNYLVMNDFVCGAATFVRTEIYVKYLKRIVGKVKYAEDNIFRLMVLDGIYLYYYHRKIIWYEFGTGISTQNSKKWLGLLKKDVNTTNEIMFQTKMATDFFCYRYKFFLQLGAKKIIKFLIFPEAFFYKMYRHIFPSYTEVICKTEFYEKLGEPL